MKRKFAYQPIAASDVPRAIRFDVPPQNQGQTVEIAYADYPTPADEACHGATYQRVTDRSDNSVTYYKRESQS
jgi:hypothetical protein